MSIIKLQPACKDYLWGGVRLREEYNKKSDKPVIAETWELSCHPDGQSIVLNGDMKGKTLSEYVACKGIDAIGTDCNRFSKFPVLIKLIDANKPLSVQVHPSDEYALKYENEYGKTEMWYIIDCGKDAFLYYGFEKEITKEEFAEKIKNNTLTEVLHKAPVKKGDVFFIESGTIHAIGADILIAEIQQSSNCTYRVYDYGRLGADGKPRELHIEKAKDVTKLCPAKPFACKGNRLAECKYFAVDKLNVSDSKELHTNNKTFHSIIVLNGSGKISCSDNTIEFNKGDSIFIDSSTGKYVIEGNCDALLTTIPEI